MNIIKGLLSLYSWRYPIVLVYMLQNTEYQAQPYLAWFWRTTNFSKVLYRRELVYTKPARLLLYALRLGILLQVAAGLGVLALWYWSDLLGGWQFGLALLISYPLVWAHLVAIPLALGRWLIIEPRQRALIRKSEEIFRDHKGIKIAIAGSYGKTSMKELLMTVLGDSKKVAATPANKNVSISHAYFATRLTGDEDILIIEYGEGAPGDVTRFARITHPTHAIITGIAPAHLDRYKTVERAANDIFSLADYVEATNLYVNAESPYTDKLLSRNSDYQAYDQFSAMGWKIADVSVSFDGVRFKMTKGNKVLALHSALMGRHQVGPLALAAALGDHFGLSKRQIEIGIGRTGPFEHRMQPRQQHGAWIIDDTYNGNIEGIKAGTQLLKDLPAKRKIYVTPGLVDQGASASKIHRHMGRLIADAAPDRVVLMKNTATADIQKGLQEAGYKGKVSIETDPLAYYTNIESFLAAGDVVMMQNDWTDNYA